MRPLSELVKFRNDLVVKLEQLSLVDSIGGVIQQLNLSVTENYEVDVFTAHDKLEQAVIDYQKILDQSEFIRNNLKSIISDVDSKILELASATVPLLKYYEYSAKQEVSTVFVVDADVHQLIKDRMSHYGNHRFPGLRLGCRYFGQLTPGAMNQELTIEYSNLLVANDPLYFYDVNPSSITAVTAHFNDVYKRRIRLYQAYTQLPQRQFNFIFCWGVFNYLALNEIQSQLHIIFGLLRAGGTVMFSYNNCDIVESAKIVDLGEMSFVSKRNLVEILITVGFEIVAEYDLVNSDPLITNISWLEARRPGELRTAKLKQVMGLVVQK